jgi:hypothetical protein
MAYQFTKQDIADMHKLNKEDLLEENNLPKDTNFDDFIVLWNYQMFHKQTLKNLEYKYVDENYKLLTDDDMMAYYNSLTEEEKEDYYPTFEDYIDEGISKNGILAMLNFE